MVELEFPTVTQDKTIGEILQIIKEKAKELKYIDYIYVVDNQNNLVGVISIRDLFIYPEHIKVEEIMQKKLITVHSKTKPQRIAYYALKHNIKAIPVVENGKLINVISPKKIISKLNYALRKEIFHFAGIKSSHLEYEHSLDASIANNIMHRLPWLLVGLFGIIIVAGFINIYEKTLEENIILAFFIPAVVYISDSLGTQQQAIFIRDLAVIGPELKIGKYFTKQMLTATLISLILSIMMYLAITIIWLNQKAAFAISLATFLSLIFANFSALIITIIIEKVGQDPALGSGPFATIISDASTVMIYFFVASALV